jgi:hypothetical protein
MLATLAYMDEFNFPKADSEYRQAVKLSPNSARTRQSYGLFLAQIGRSDQGIAELKRAQLLDPLSFDIRDDLGLAFYLGHLYEEAIATFQTDDVVFFRRRPGDQARTGAGRVVWLAARLLASALRLWRHDRARPVLLRLQSRDTRDLRLGHPDGDRHSVCPRSVGSVGGPDTQFCSNISARARHSRRIGAILVIAIFYSEHVSYLALIVGSAVLGILLLMRINRRVRHVQSAQ